MPSMKWRIIYIQIFHLLLRCTINDNVWFCKTVDSSQSILQSILNLVPPVSPSCRLFLSSVKNWHWQHLQNIIWKFRAYIQACSCYILCKPTFSFGWQVQCICSPYEHPYLASTFHLVWKWFTCKISGNPGPKLLSSCLLCTSHSFKPCSYPTWC